MWLSAIKTAADPKSKPKKILVQKQPPKVAPLAVDGAVGRGRRAQSEHLARERENSPERPAVIRDDDPRRAQQSSRGRG